MDIFRLLEAIRRPEIRTRVTDIYNQVRDRRLSERESRRQTYKRRLDSAVGLKDSVDRWEMLRQKLLSLNPLPDKASGTATENRFQGLLNNPARQENSITAPRPPLPTPEAPTSAPLAQVLPMVSLNRVGSQEPLPTGSIPKDPSTSDLNSFRDTIQSIYDAGKTTEQLVGAIDPSRFSVLRK